MLVLKLRDVVVIGTFFLLASVLQAASIANQVPFLGSSAFDIRPRVLLLLRHLTLATNSLQVTTREL